MGSLTKFSNCYNYRKLLLETVRDSPHIAIIVFKIPITVCSFSKQNIFLNFIINFITYIYMYYFINFQCQGILLHVICKIVGQGPTVLAVAAGGGCLDIFFSRLIFLSSFSLSLGDDPI